MDALEEYRFQHIYEYVDLINECVKYREGFWNYNEEYFIAAATKFSKDTLLHLYIVTASINFHKRDFRKNGDFIDGEKWQAIFHNYSINIEMFDFENEDHENAIDWLESNVKKFEELFDKMADEIFYILFANRSFLLSFCNLVSTTIKESNIHSKFLTKKGTIKRTTIPAWVKKAVYHRDKGRCVFCNTDLTGVINTLSNHNYDHIVPLDLFGPNDPCNIQLTCESCNKKKRNKIGVTSNNYIPWWPK